MNFENQQDVKEYRIDAQHDYYSKRRNLQLDNEIRKLLKRGTENYPSAL